MGDARPAALLRCRHSLRARGPRAVPHGLGQAGLPWLPKSLEATRMYVPWQAEEDALAASSAEQARADGRGSRRRGLESRASQGQEEPHRQHDVEWDKAEEAQLASADGEAVPSIFVTADLAQVSGYLPMSYGQCVRSHTCCGLVCAWEAGSRAWRLQPEPRTRPPLAPHGAGPDHLHGSGHAQQAASGGRAAGALGGRGSCGPVSYFAWCLLTLFRPNEPSRAHAQCPTERQSGLFHSRRSQGDL